MAGLTRLVWLLEVGDPVTEYAASDDCTDDADYTLLGAVYLRRIRDPQRIAVTERMPDILAGVTPAATASVTLSLSDWAAAAPWSTDWRGQRARLKIYDRTAGTVSTLLTGVVNTVTWGNNACVVDLISYDTGVLDRLVPARTINVDEFPSATDLGAPVPLIWGRAYLSPPACGGYDPTDPDTDARGFDLCVAPVLSHSGAAYQLAIEAVYIDGSGGNSPTLDLVSAWTDGPGTPAYASATTFTVTSDGTEDAIYSVAAFGGKPLRCKTTASGGAWVYSHVTAYDSGTNAVTIADAKLDSGLTDVQLLGGDYVHERGRYIVSGRALNTLRFFAESPGGIVVEAHASGGDGTPSEVIRDVLSDPVFGLAQSCDASTFTSVGAALGTAGLADAINYALGGDRRQRTAREFIDQVCSLRGMRLWFDGSLWYLAADAQPATPTSTLGYGDGVYDNVVAIRARRRSSLADTVRRIYLRYGPLGREHRSEDAPGWLNLQGYRYSIYAEVNERGSDRVVSMPLLTTHAAAARVLCYWARRLRAADDTIDLTAGREALTLALGAVCTVRAPHLGIDGTYRVRQRTRRLTDVDLVLEGYDATMFTYDADEVQYEDGYGTRTVADAAGADARTALPGVGGNLLINADFSAHVRGTELTGDARLGIPGWFWNNADGLSYTAIRGTDTALACVGGGYLDVTVSSVLRALQMLDTTDDVLSGIAVSPGTLYYASIYADTFGGWQFQVQYQTAAGTVLGGGFVRPNLHRDSSDTNGNGWQRVYVATRAPATAARAIVRILFVKTGSYRFDAAQFEPASSRQRKPSNWRRSPRYGLDPALLAPGELTIRGEGELSHGTRIGHASMTVACSGTTSTATGLIPSNSVVIGVTARVLTAIEGTTAWNLGTSINPTAWGASLDVALGTSVGPDDWDTLTGVSFLDASTATDIVLTATGGTFSAGSVKLTVHYKELLPPTG